MSAIGSLIIAGALVTVVHADGTEEPFETLRIRAQNTLPEELRGDMSQSMVSDQSGNVRISFDGSYYPRKGNMGDGEYRVHADQMRTKRLLTASAIYNELLKAGVPWDHVTFKDSWFKQRIDRSTGQPVKGADGRAVGSYEPTFQLWLNKTRTSEVAGGRSASHGPSKQELTVAFIATFDSPIDGGKALKELKSTFDDESTLLAVIQAHVDKAAIVNKVKAQPSVGDTKTDAGKNDEMPQG